MTDRDKELVDSFLAEPWRMHVNHAWSDTVQRVLLEEVRRLRAVEAALLSRVDILNHSLESLRTRRE